MGKFIKAYGINGLLEWHGYVVYNGIRMKVDFTNGSVTAFGVAPATFTTKDELTQHIIENSDQFKDGKIRLLSSAPLPGEEQDKNAALKEPAEEAAEEAPELKKVNVSCNDDAKEYLTSNFDDVKASEMRTKAQINSVGKAHGVEFVWE